MTDDTHACEQYADNLAELALGILTGRDTGRHAGPR